MANNTFKRSIAMLLVLNMLTGMLPIQALADEGNTEAPVITVTVTPSESSSEKKESAPAEKQEAAPAEEKTEPAPAEKQEAAPAEKTESAEVASYDDNDSAKIEHDSNLTLGENVDVSKETVTGTDEEGNTVVTETTEVTTSGATENGDQVNGEETFVETTTTTETEIIVESVLDGEQTTESTEDIAPGEEVPEVVAPIIPDAEGVEEGTVTEKVEGEDGTVTETTTTIEKVTDETTGEESVKVTVNVTETSKETVGDVKEGEDDTDFDFSEVVTIVDRTVTTEATGSIEQTDDSTIDLEQIIAPEDYEGKHYDTHDKITGFTQPDGLLNGLNPDNVPSTESPEEGYDYVISGNGDATWAAAPVVMQVVYQRDADGNPIPDGNGGYLIDEEKSKLVYAGSKAGNSGMNSTPGQIVVKNENGELFYTYCIDKATPTEADNWYKVSNLEDSDYYANEESAAMLRAIVTNGYWGTDANVYETDEEGNVLVDEEGNKIAKRDENGKIVTDDTVAGSLAKMKALLRSTYGENDTVTVKDAKGNEHTYNIVDLIDGLKEHEALAATQSAIWSYSNSSLQAQSGVDGEMIIGVQSAKKFFNGAAQDRPLNQYAPAYNLESDARLKALYECLMGLEPVSQDDESVSTVINEKNYVEDMGLTIKDKVEDHEDNKDDNDDNDVYNTELNFTLAFVPDSKTDDLLVYLLDDQGNKINGADGKPIVKRLAGETTGDEESITADENGVYTLTGIQLSENSEFKFDLKLEGTHLLKDGVYIYTAHGGREDSQTLVGMASGTQNVNVHASMSIKFEVDESKTVVASRKWRETSEETTPRVPGDNPPPVEYRMGFGVGQLEVIEEEVPLAAPPQTGDMSILWFAMIVMSGCGLCILNLLEKRKCQA